MSISKHGINSNLFDWKLYYDANRNEDHLDNFTANYNGNINASLGTYKFAMAENIPQNFGELANSAYNYQYDKLNRLIVANAKISLVETLADQDKLGDAFYVYDKIGNIERLNRHSFAMEGALAIVNNNYTYNYASGNNRLLSVYEEIIGNGGGSVTSNTLAEYAYDASGNLTSDTKRQLTVGQYGRAHLPWQMGKTSDVVIAGPEGGSSPLTSTIRYLYDANDARIYKSSQGSLGPEISEYYLRSASGQELAVYDLNTDELTWYVYGNERVAKIKNDPSLTEEEEDDRDTEYEGIPTSTPNPPIPPGNSCASRHPRCFGFGTNLQRDFVLNTQLSAIHAQNAARVASLQALYSAEESTQLNLPDTWMQLEMANETTQYVLRSQLSSIKGTYTVVDQLVLNSTAQQIQVQLNGNTISLSLSELLGEEVGEETTNDDGVGDPYDAPLDILDDPGIPEASYYIQDHLGNTRIVYKPLFCGEELLSYDVEYVGDYFPYGKIIREYVKGKKEKYLTTHHERDEETGLDYRGARFYDSDVARFLSLDPAAASYSEWSAYNYVLGNPAKLIDETGKFVIDPELKKKYPRVASYIESILTSYEQKPNYFKDAIKKNSGLDDGQISDLLKSNSGALVKFGDLSKQRANGVTEMQIINFVDNGSPVFKKQLDIGEILVGGITIDTKIIENLEVQLWNLENNIGSTEELKAALILFESTLYHEFTHFGDVYSDCNLNCSDYTVVKENGKYKIDIAKVGEEGGKKFEIAAYGKDISGYNVKTYVRENGKKTEELLRGTPASQQ